MSSSEEHIILENQKPNQTKPKTSTVMCLRPLQNIKSITLVVSSEFESLENPKGQYKILISANGRLGNSDLVRELEVLKCPPPNHVARREKTWVAGQPRYIHSWMFNQLSNL